jgi:hypothetical protein
MRVAICTPSRDEVKAGFCFALAELLLANNSVVELTLIPFNERGPEIAKVRNLLVHRALDKKADALLWIDSDIVFPFYGLTRLLSQNKEIVGATYAMRSQLHSDMMTPALAHEELETADSPEASGLRRVKSLPGGAVLVRSDVYATHVKKPWYESLPDSPEDWNFCAKARAAGLSIYLDSVLSDQVIHLGEYAYRVNP